MRCLSFLFSSYFILFFLSIQSANVQQYGENIKIRTSEEDHTYQKVNRKQILSDSNFFLLFLFFVYLLSEKK